MGHVRPVTCPVVYIDQLRLTTVKGFEYETMPQVDEVRVGLSTPLSLFAEGLEVIKA